MTRHRPPTSRRAAPRAAPLAVRLRLVRRRGNAGWAAFGDALRDWRSSAAGRVTLAAGAGLLLYLVWLVVPGVGREARATWSGLALVPSGLLVTAFCWRTACCAAVDPQARRAWRLLAAANLVYLFADVVWLVLGRPVPSLADVGFLAFYPIAFAGLLSFPRARETPGRRLQFWLDSATVMLAGVLVVWHLAVGPLAAAGHGRLGWFVASVAVGYPVGDLLLLFGSSALLLRGCAGQGARAVALVGAGTIVYLVADVVYVAMMLAGTYDGASPTDVGWVMGQLLVAVGAHVHHRAAVRAAGPAVPAAAPRRGRALYVLPYAAVAVVYALLLVVARREWSLPAASLLVGAVALTALVGARQVLAMLENTRLETLAAARRGEARFAALVQQSSDVVAVLGADTRILYASPSMERVFGWAPADIVGSPLLDAVHEEDRELVLGELHRVSARPGATSLVCMRVRRPDGIWRHAESSLTNLVHDPAVGGVVLNGRDVTERKRLEAALAHQAFHDSLTHLPNRALFHDRVVHALARSERDGVGVAVLFLDLDDFKTVNDSLGHAAGDRLLFEVAGRLLSATRGSDTVARLGGDEFAVLLENVRHDEDALVVADRILASLRRPVLLEGTPVAAGGSFGIARARPGEDAETLLRNADVAMYLAKQRGKAGYEIFAPGMHAEMLERLGIENDLRLALDRGEFHLAYQPIVTLVGGRVAGFEALARWTHPLRGPVSPAHFVPHAERTGLVVPLGRWVLREACRQMGVWRHLLGPAGQGLGVSVNVSAVQLQDGARLVDDVRDALADAGLPPEYLTLEITESAMMQDPEAAHLVLSRLSALRVRLAVDDFGTGYSSLSYIERFPVDVLKIDKSFVDRIAGEGDAAGGESPLTAAIILIGQTLGLRVVAEGIERAAQAHRLRDLGCELGQGHLFARALPPEEVERRLVHAPLPERAIVAGAA